MDFKVVVSEFVYWIQLAQDRVHWRKLMSAVMNLVAQWDAWNLFTNWATVSFQVRLSSMKLVTVCFWAQRHCNYRVS